MHLLHSQHKILLVMNKNLPLLKLITVKIFTVFFILLFCNNSSCFGIIRYVKIGGAGTAPYTSWATASNDLQAVINACIAGDEIWVATGTYRPNRRADALLVITANNRNNAFVLKNAVKIYGGFTGVENFLSQRNWVTNITILSGDIGIAGNNTDNCFHVVICAGISNCALDGFHVREGNATGGIPVSIFGETINAETAAGIAIYGAGITILNCFFSGNRAVNGAAVYIDNHAAPTITNCSFSGNQTSNNGGAICNHASSSKFISCVLYGNSAAVAGGAIHFAEGGAGINPVMSNCTIAGNKTEGPYGSIQADAAVIIYNSVIFGNYAPAGVIQGAATVSNSCLQESYTGTNNFVADPKFIARISGTEAPTENGDYHLQFCSPAIDAGDNTLVPAGITTDRDNNTRISNSIVDRGAYENINSVVYAIPDAGGIVYVDHTKSGNGNSWANATAELSNAFKAAENNPAITQIWVAKGTYKPQYNRGGLGACNDPANRFNSFVLKTGVKIYGGFAGTETLLSQRNWVANVTILSGDIGTPRIATDNCYNVVISAGSVGTAELNGFTVTGGYADFGFNYPINSQTITTNSGAGLIVQNSSPVIANCIFISNIASANGGGLYASSSIINLKACIFSGNKAGAGGGIFMSSASGISLTNCLVSGNMASNGAGLFSSAAVPSITNCTFAGNNALSNAGGLYFGASPAVALINNCIVYGNRNGSVVSNFFTATGATPEVRRSIIENTAGFTNIAFNTTGFSPQFINPQDAALAPTSLGNYSVNKCSPALNTGDNSYIAGFATDVAGNVRILNTTVDKGAYENNSTVSAVPNGSGVVFVDKSKSGDGSSWANAVPELSEAMLAARTNTAITQIWVTEGTYYPLYDIGFTCTPIDAKDKTFVLVNNVKLHGGFAGGETTVTQRNWAQHPTILSGDIGVANDRSDNCYHIVVSAGAVGTAELDGFTMQDGEATGSGTVNINSISFARGSCGGMYIINSSPAISNCFVKNNKATGVAGGVYASNSNAVFTNCIISGNASTSGGSSGGGIFNNNPSGTAALTLRNCTIAGNKAGILGGFQTSTAGTVKAKIYNSIIYGNETNAGAANSDLGSTAGTNDDPDVYYSTIGNAASSGVYTSVISNSTANPLFTNVPGAAAAPTSSGNYRLQKCSPAINTGSNTYVPAANTKDLNGNSRTAFTTVDRGAFEKILAQPNADGIVYVNQSKAENEVDGSSWDKAITQLGDALKAAKFNTAIQQIWVAKGTYKPIWRADFITNIITDCPNLTDRDNSFVLVPDVKVYGGFEGGETNTNVRDLLTNETILSGDLVIVNNTVDNCYHVLVSTAAVGTAALDGFTISLGNTSTNTSITNKIIVNTQNVFRYRGAGIFCGGSSPALLGCNFTANVATSGGGICNMNSSAPIFTKCNINQNTAQSGGAGIFNVDSDPTFTNCIITKNNAATFGAGMYNFNSPAIINSSIFSENNAANGGGMMNENSSPVVTNATFSKNTAGINGGAVANINSSPTINNTIIWGNTAPVGNAINVSSGVPVVNYSIIEGGFSGTNNLNLNPLFVDAVSGDFRLQPCSPAINIGSNAVVSGLTDLDNNPRITYNDVDLGTYEQQTNIYVDGKYTAWKGIDNEWHKKINWCGGIIPTAEIDVTILATSNNPVLSANGETKNLVLSNTTGISTTNTCQFTINGTYTNSGSTLTNNGTWIMAGNQINQTFPGISATVSAMNNVEINNSSGIKFDKSFEIKGTLIPTAGNITIDNATITLNSDATSTARVAAVPSTVALSYTGTGKFEVERYIPPHRAWRLLTAPLSTATNLTISQAWQEGLSNANRLTPVIGTANFGTSITKSTTYSAADGYDQGSTSSPSIRYYNGTNWGGFPSKTIGTTPGANDGLINDQPGYMLFVRGDRSIVVAGTGVAATVTTLRPKGQLKVGPQTITCAGWTVIGNPYASPINFHKIVVDNPGLPDVFYVWDANLAGSFNVGGWVSYGAYNIGTQTYTVAPLLAGSTFANNKGDISSGSAFMINYTGTITINENNKSTLGDNVLLRPVRQLSMNLYVANADSSETLIDGLAILMDRNMQAANAEKNKNFTENFAIAADNKRYAIQNRRRPIFNDTIFISAGQMKQRNYLLELKADELDMPRRMKAYLEDTYLHQYSPVALEGNTRYAFSVNADSGSVSAVRFRLLFKKAPRFLHISAIVKEKDIEVQWEVENDFGVARYEVERSVNGIDFTTLHGQTTTRNNEPLLKNSWLDVSPVTSAYYYRIKATLTDGETVYSDVAKATIVKNAGGMYAYPNPVTDNVIQLRMNDMPAGHYSASLLGMNGQVILTQQWNHTGGFVTKKIELPAATANGTFQLQLTKPGGKQQILPVEVIQ